MSAGDSESASLASIRRSSARESAGIKRLKGEKAREKTAEGEGEQGGRRSERTAGSNSRTE